MEEYYEKQTLNKLNNKKRQILDLHQREAQIQNENLQFLRNQERVIKRKQAALQEALDFENQQLQQLQQQSELCAQRIQYHQNELHRLQHE